MVEIAYKTGSNNVSTIKICSERRIEAGTEPKYRIRALVIGKGFRQKEVSLVVKEIQHPGGADGFVKEWQRLKKAGVPTIPTVRKISPREVIMTDMAVDGSAFFGKNDLWPSTVRKKKNKLTKIDEEFLKIDLKKIETEGIRIANLATINGISLPYDDPFDLLVHPDGTWQLLVVDIDNDGINEGTLEDHNLTSVYVTIKHLDTVRNILLGITIY